MTFEEKLMNKIKNDKKMFTAGKKRLHMQNQDFINNYNSLTYDSKYFKNLLKAYEETLDEDDKNYIFNNHANAKQFSKNFIAMAINTGNILGEAKSSRNLLN